MSDLNIPSYALRAMLEVKCGTFFRHIVEHFVVQNVAYNKVRLMTYDKRQL